jgi:putative ubiquitin-RnfH superfamily antitoxin RatB of RatAB toxin-antitoxin module
MSTATAEVIEVEVVAAVPARQKIVRLALPVGATAFDAVQQANLQDDFPEIDFAGAKLAVWGKPVGHSHALRSGDRVEVLRPLAMDPRDARRELARAGKSMGPAGGE